MDSLRACDFHFRDIWMLGIGTLLAIKVHRYPEMVRLGGIPRGSWPSIGIAHISIYFLSGSGSGEVDRGEAFGPVTGR
jgi:hypothetical protein